MSSAIDLIISVCLEPIFLLPNYIYARIKKQKFEVNKVKTNHQIYALLFWLGLIGGITLAEKVFAQEALHKANFDGFMRDFKDATEPSHLVDTAFKKIEDQDTFEKSEGTRSALDVGAGTGRDTLFLLKKGWRVTAIDSNKQGIELIRSKASKECTSNLEVLELDFDHIPLHKKYDLVISNWSIDYASPETYPTILKNLKSLVSKNGRLAISFFGDEHTGIKKSVVHTLHKQSEILPMIGDDFEIEYFNAVKQHRKGYVWHVFEVVAKRK